MDSTNRQIVDALTRSVLAKPAADLRRGRHPLLALSIGRRLALGLLIPILAVLLSLGNIGLQS